MSRPGPRTRGANAAAPWENSRLLEELGVFTGDTFREHATAVPEFVIDNLFAAGSVNLLVGNSNLGKTPFAVMAGLAVSAGVPFLGERVPRARTVLYVDYESSAEQFRLVVDRLLQALALERQPERFLIHSPNWVEGESRELLSIVERLQPEVVILDPLRSYAPSAESEAPKAAALLRELKQTGITWLITHHRRKQHPDRVVRLDAEPHAWFQEAAGSHALVNQTDTRLGFEQTTNTGTAELVVAGFRRGVGILPPRYLARQYDEESGEPIGYILVGGADLLPVNWRDALGRLPAEFRFTAAKAVIGNSNANTQHFIDRCKSLGLIEQTGRGAYIKKDGNGGFGGNATAADGRCSHGSHPPAPAVGGASHESRGLANAA